MEACHSPQQSNVTSFSATALAIITLEAFAGMWINAFLVCVLCIAWVKKKSLNSNEKILLLLGCCRFWHLFISWAYSFLSIFYPDYLYVHTVLQLTVSFETFFNYSNLWVSACLCVFYCIKIAIFRNSWFIYLKVKIDRMVPWLLLGSGILALAISIIAYNIADKLHCNNHNSTGQGNFWEPNIKMDKHFFPTFFLAGFGYAAPSMTLIFSAVFLLFSLWRHKRKMQTNSMNSLSVDAHIRAMKSILSFFIIYNINFITQIVTMIYLAKEWNLNLFIIYVFLYALPGLHSIILILSNPKLEKTLLRILPCVKCKVCMK